MARQASRNYQNDSESPIPHRVFQVSPGRAAKIPAGVCRSPVRRHRRRPCPARAGKAVPGFRSAGFIIVRPRQGQGPLIDDTALLAGRASNRFDGILEG
jgi:hypothetical protein